MSLYNSRVVVNKNTRQLDNAQAKAKKYSQM